MSSQPNITNFFIKPAQEPLPGPSNPSYPVAGPWKIRHHGHHPYSGQNSKNRRQQKNYQLKATRLDYAKRRNRPEWFHRLCRGRYFNRDPEPEDFDEDLSDLNSEDEKDPRDCDCDQEGDMFMMSGHYCGDLDDSGSGSDGEHYISLYELRKDAKKDLIEIQKLRLSYFDEEKQEIENILAGAEAFKIAYDLAEKEGKKLPLKSIKGQEFDLFNMDYTDKVSKWWPHSPQDWTAKRIHFVVHDPEEKDVVHPAIYFEDSLCRCIPIPIPTHASPEGNGEIKLQAKDARYTIWLRFLGDGLVSIRAPRDLVFEQIRKSPKKLADLASVPAVMQ